MEQANRRILIVYFGLSMLLLSSIALSTTMFAVGKKHRSHNDESSDTSSSPLPTVNPLRSSKENSNNSPQQASGLSFDNIRDIKDNQPNYPVIFVNNIVKRMSDSKQLHMMGEVKNIGNKRLGLVEIIATYYDSSNKTLGNDAANPMPAGLELQQTAPFDLVASDFIPVDQIASIKWHLAYGRNPFTSGA